MSLHRKVGTAWTPVKDLWVKRAGVWTPVRRAFTKRNGVWTQYFQDEVVYTINGGPYGNILIRDLFGGSFPGAWADPLLTKRLVINSTLNAAATWGAIAIQSGGLTTADSWAGDLVIENRGAIHGMGGQPNGGAGATAFYANFPSRTGAKATLINYGNMAGGGGAGGRGGDGGLGYYDNPYIYQEGPTIAGGGSSQGTYWRRGQGQSVAFWGGAQGSVGDINATALNAGGWDYYRDSYNNASGGYEIYRIRRSQVRYNPANYSGGAGGNGGRGWGGDGANQGGAGGGAPGTNAGWGGTGGTGGGPGASGNPGNAGGNGNAGGGAAGGAGGLGGFYIDGIANVNFTNNGNLWGRVR